MRRRLEGLAFLSSGLLFAYCCFGAVWRWPIYFGLVHASEANAMGPQAVTVTNQQFVIEAINITGSLALTIYFFFRLRAGDKHRA